MSHLRLDTVSAAHGGRANQKPELIDSSLDKWGDKPKSISYRRTVANIKASSVRLHIKNMRLS